MHTLTNWRAMRSGPGITVHGDNERGQRVKCAVSSIEPVEGRIIAHGRDAIDRELLLA